MIFFSCLLSLFLLMVNFVNSQNNNSTEFLECLLNEVDPDDLVINSNSFVQFQSPNFPQSLSIDSYFESCNINFKAKNSNDFLWIALLNGQINEAKFISGATSASLYNLSYFDSNKKISTFISENNLLGFNIPKSSDNDGSLWSAYQAIVWAFDPHIIGDSCPLSSGQIINLNGSNHILIPITSDFNNGKLSVNKKQCSWKFIINQEQKLKVVIKHLVPSSKSSLKLTIDGKLAHSFDSAVDVLSPQIFYFNGTSFEFEYLVTELTNASFFAIISAVYVNPLIFVDGKCKDSFLGYSNFDPNSGYGPNEICEKVLSIPETFEASINVFLMDIEFGGDSLSIIDDNGTIYPISQNTYTLTHELDNSTLTFLSDGNTQQAGFEIFLGTKKCDCDDTEIQVLCDGKQHVHMKDLTYCGNQDCFYTIIKNETCPNKYIALLTLATIRDSIDFLTFFIDGKPLKNLTTSMTMGDEQVYTSDVNITMQFHSGPRNKIEMGSTMWGTTIILQSPPNFKKYILNLSNPTQIFWLDDMKPNDAITVCSPKNNTDDVLEMFVSHEFIDAKYGMAYYSLYDSDDLRNYISNLDNNITISTTDISIPRSIKSVTGCFTIYLPRDTLLPIMATVLFRLHKAHTKNCINNNIYQLELIQAPILPPANIKASNGGECEMIILASQNIIPGLLIKNLTAMTGFDYIFKSTVNQNQLFKLDGAESEIWQNIGIYAPALSVIAPPNSEISVQLQLVQNNNFEINFESGITKRKGIMNSPSFSGFYGSLENPFLYEILSIENITLDLNVTILNGNQKSLVLYNFDWGIITQLEQGQNIVEVGERFLVNYTQNDPNVDYFLLEYTIENPKENDTECICSDSQIVVNCNQSKTITTLSTDTSQCPNQDCIYQIVKNESCPQSYFEFDILTNIVDNETFLTIYVNGKVDEKLDSTSFNNKYFYSSRVNLTIKFHTGPSYNNHTDDWIITIATRPPPNFLPKIELNNSISSRILALWLGDLKANDAIIVCSSTKDEVLELFISHKFGSLISYNLYDAMDIYSFVSTLDDATIILPSNGPIPRHLTSSSGCFTIHAINDDNDFARTSILFRMKKAHTENCIGINVFQGDDWLQNQSQLPTLTVESNPNGSCEMVILASQNFIPGISISDINPKINSTTKYIFKSGINQKQLLELEGNEVEFWPNIGIYTYALIVSVPPSSAISLTARNINTTSFIYGINSDLKPQKGIMASPSFCGFSSSFCDYKTLYSFVIIEDVRVNIFVKNVSGSTENLIIETSTKNSTMEQGQNFTQNGRENLEVLFLEKDPIKDYFFAEYTIEYTRNGYATKNIWGMISILICWFVVANF